MRPLSQLEIAVLGLWIAVRRYRLLDILRWANIESGQLPAGSENDSTGLFQQIEGSFR